MYIYIYNQLMYIYIYIYIYNQLMYIYIYDQLIYIYIYDQLIYIYVLILFDFYALCADFVGYGCIKCSGHESLMSE